MPRKTEQISSSSIKVNADNGFAHTAINMGLKLLCEMSKMRVYHVCLLTIHIIAEFLAFIPKELQKNLIGIGFTNAPASIAIGSIKPVIGTNPYSIAAPQNGRF